MPVVLGSRFVLVGGAEVTRLDEIEELQSQLNGLRADLECAQAWRADALEAYDRTGSPKTYREYGAADRAVDAAARACAKVRELLRAEQKARAEMGAC